jgi:ribose transport system ATP-binding protein
MPPPVLAIEGLTKSFGGTRALRGVSLEVAAGRVHGLVGQNGSGKSTLIKILSGFHVPDDGSLHVHGEPVRLPIAHRTLQELGIAFVHQDLGLVPTMSVMENLAVGRFDTGFGRRIRWGAERSRTLELLRRFELDVEPETRVERLSQAERAIVAIIRALPDVEQHARGGLLVLDEPTAALPAHEIGRLFDAIRSIARSGSAVLIVTHNLDEVFDITDDVSVLRDGRLVAERSTAGLAERELIGLIVGRDLGTSTTGGDHRAGSAVMDAEDLHGEVVHGVSVSVRRGEILGLTGLVGAGHDELPYLLAGARPVRSGRLTVDGKETANLTPERAKRAGVVLLPGDRQHQSAILGASVRENVTLPALPSFRGRFGAIDRRREREVAQGVLERFDVHPPELERPMLTLSGGNQQKALLGRCLRMDPQVLLLHEPTQGVDIGARQGIFGFLREAADAGTAVVCSSVEYEDLANVCDRVLVFRRGRVVADLSGSARTHDAILAHCYQTERSL